MERVLVLLLLVAMTAANVIRVDTQKGFKFCNIRQVARLEQVTAQGPGCRRWPCLLIAGRTGVFHITISQHTGAPINHLWSDIHADVRLHGLGGLTGRQRVGLPGETKKPACQFTRPGCPFHSGSTITITKSITVPSNARMAQSPMTVEFRVSDEFGRVLTCFTAPVIVA